MGKIKNPLLKTLKDAGIDNRTIDAVMAVGRSKYIDPFYHNRLDELVPLPIGFGETSDDPLTLARMIQFLAPERKWRVLEIGTGSGYSTAIIANLVNLVVTVEYHEQLARSAKALLDEEGFFNIRFLTGDASVMRQNQQDVFDAVIIHAACVHRPFSIFSTLREGGKAVFPMGPAFRQQIVVYKNFPVMDHNNPFRNMSFHDYCHYDSIRGQYGWVDQTEPEGINEEGDKV